jgi:16S rRNA processing protein RimM
MIKKETFNLGHFSKTRGLNGEIVAFFDVDYPEEYSELELMFVEIDNTLVPFFVDDITIKSNGFVNILLEDIINDEQAKELVGCKIYLPNEFLAELNDDQFYYHEIVGYTLIDDKSKAKAIINQVVEYPNNKLLEVTFQNEIILVPFNDDFIISIDKDKKELVMNIPEGILDLN